MISPHAERNRRPGTWCLKEFCSVLHRDIATIPKFTMKLNGSAALYITYTYRVEPPS